MSTKPHLSHSHLREKASTQPEAGPAPCERHCRGVYQAPHKQRGLMPCSQLAAGPAGEPDAPSPCERPACGSLTRVSSGLLRCLALVGRVTHCEGGVAGKGLWGFHLTVAQPSPQMPARPPQSVLQGQAGANSHRDSQHPERAPGSRAVERARDPGTKCSPVSLPSVSPLFLTV